MRFFPIPVEHYPGRPNWSRSGAHAHLQAGFGTLMWWRLDLSGLAGPGLEAQDAGAALREVFGEEKPVRRVSRAGRRRRRQGGWCWCGTQVGRHAPPPAVTVP